MSLMLNAISRATDDGRHAAERAKVVKAIFATRDRQSVLGPYGIDANGDTTARTFGVWTIGDGKLRFWGKMDG
jgi:branched-chain amino acid transport system substrate-binding protein